MTWLWPKSTIDRFNASDIGLILISRKHFSFLCLEFVDITFYKKRNTLIVYVETRWTVQVTQSTTVTESILAAQEYRMHRKKKHCWWCLFKRPHPSLREYVCYEIYFKMTCNVIQFIIWMRKVNEWSFSRSICNTKKVKCCLEEYLLWWMPVKVVLLIRKLNSQILNLLVKISQKLKLNRFCSQY